MMIADALGSDPQIDVIDTAANGRIALTMVEELRPDLVVMDLEMPIMDGIETIRALRRRGERLPIIAFSSKSSQDAQARFDALAAGATDFVTKPSNMISGGPSLRVVAGQLVPKIKDLVPHPGSGSGGSGSTGTAARAGHDADVIPLAPSPPGPLRPVRAVVIGASMGGPEALSLVLGNLVKLPVPVAVVQHMPPNFTRQLAERLDLLSLSTVLESAGGEELQPGHVYIAPGGYHLELHSSAQGAYTVLDDGPPVNFSRPSVDTLFRSAVTVFGGDLLAVVLTGMGHDGRAGSEAVVAAGGRVVVQDEASSLVWGMPGAVANAGLAHRVVPLRDMGSTIFSMVHFTRPVHLP